MLASSHVKYLHGCFPKDSTSWKSPATESLIIKKHGRPLNVIFVPTPPPHVGSLGTEQINSFNDTKYTSNWCNTLCIIYHVFIVILDFSLSQAFLVIWGRRNGFPSSIFVLSNLITHFPYLFYQSITCIPGVRSSSPSLPWYCCIYHSS